LCDEVTNTSSLKESYQQLNKEKVLPTRSTIRPFASIKDAAMERILIAKQEGTM
jgi:hypothetical protein